MTIRRQLTCSYLGILALLGCNLLVYLWTDTRRERAFEDLRRTISRQTLISSVQGQLSDYQKQVALLSQITGEGGLSVPSKDEIDQFNGRLDSIEREIEQVGSLTDPEDKANFFRIFRIVLAVLSGLMLTAADQDWKGKPPADWTEAEAKQILSDSPWTKVIAPAVLKSIYPEKDQAHGWRSKIGLGGPAHQSADTTGNSGSKSEPPKPPPAPALKLRWESALPVRLAERKVPDPAAPTVDDDYYVMAVYGIPRTMVSGDLKEVTAILKKNAMLKRYAKRDMIPASVEILMRDDGPVIVYRFLKSGDINWRDQKLIFDAQVDTLKFTQTFDMDPMRFEGDLQL